MFLSFAKAVVFVLLVYSASVLFPVSAQETVISHPLFFNIENQTMAKYPDAQQKITEIVTNINNRLQSAGIHRQFTINDFSTYDKTVQTNCRLANPNGQYAPDEFCSHAPSFIYIVADEVAGSNYAFGPVSVEWHGYNGLFGSQGTSVLGHELGHILGLPDLYWVQLAASDNQVNGQAYIPFQGYIMHNLTPGNFHPWDKEIINRESASLPTSRDSWKNYQPAQNIIQIKDPSNCPLTQAQIKVYTSTANSGRVGSSIDSIPEYQGSTDNDGKFSLGGNLLSTNPFLALKIFLIEVDFWNTKTYYWLDLTHINFAYWNGQTDTAVYPFSVNTKACGIATLPTGYHDPSAESCSVDGWVCDTDNTDVPVRVEFFTGTQKIGEAISENTREEAVGNLCGGKRDHGFHYVFPADSPLRTGQDHEISVRAIDVNAAGTETAAYTSLSLTPRLIHCSPVTPSPSHTASPLQGDVNTDGHVNSADILALLSNPVNIFEYTLTVANYGK